MMASVQHQQAEVLGSSWPRIDVWKRNFNSWGTRTRASVRKRLVNQTYTEKRVVQRKQNIGKYNLKMKSLES